MPDQTSSQPANDQEPTVSSNEPRKYLAQALALIGVVAITAIVTLWVSRDEERTGVEILIPPPAPVTFQVSGEVVRPGVYSLDGEPRVNDAIDAAGGFTDDADSGLINLALHVRDGSKVVVPASNAGVDQDRSTQPTTSDTEPESSTQGNTSPNASSTENTTGPIDLNSASRDQLIDLPGIGEVRADSIIEWRANNLINSVSDLLAISGIGNATVDAIRDHVVQP